MAQKVIKNRASDSKSLWLAQGKEGKFLALRTSWKAIKENGFIEKEINSIDWKANKRSLGRN